MKKAPISRWQCFRTCGKQIRTRKLAEARKEDEPFTLFMLGQNAKKRDDFSAAERYYEKARDLWRERDSDTARDLNYLYGNMGFAALKQGK